MAESREEYSHHVEECYDAKGKEAPLVRCRSERSDEAHDYRDEDHE